MGFCNCSYDDMKKKNRNSMMRFFVYLAMFIFHIWGIILRGNKQGMRENK